MSQNTQKSQKPTILGLESVAKTNVFHIEELQLKFSNGEERRFERFKLWPPGILMVIPMPDSHTLWLIREYCAGIEDYTLSFPKGRIELNETPEQAVLREMREETGYGPDRLTHLQTITQSPNYSSTKMHLYLAQDLYESPLQGDEPEPIEVVPWKIKDLPELLNREDFHEGRALAALYLLEKHLEKSL